MVMPNQLKKKEFSKTIKGYSVPEVDEYISYILSSYQDMFNEYAELEKKYKATLHKLEEARSEESTFSSLVLDAKKMADAIVKDANEKARAATDAVNESCEKILSTYRENVTAERDKLAKMEKLAKDFKESLYSAYREHIQAIDNILPDEENSESESISTATDEELMDAAVDLARRKYGAENAGDAAETKAAQADTGAAEAK